MAVSLQTRAAAVEILIRIIWEGTLKPKGDAGSLLRSHAQEAVSALNWLATDPEAQALVRAQAERKRAS